MYAINANDLYTVVSLINRLPDRYIEGTDGRLWGVYNKLSPAELKKICSRNIKV